jgi:hypothetical protein
MTTAHHDATAGWDRLESELVTVKPGGTVSVAALIEATGLAPDTILLVLTELTRITLFERQTDDVFVRLSLWEPR